MKGLRHLLAVIFLLLAIFIVIGMLLPQDWQVEERVDIAAPPGAVFQQIATLRNWESWAVWFEHDPAMSRDYPGPESGQGSTYAWKGNKSVGEGTITVDRLDAGESIAFTLTMHDGRFVSHGEIQCRAAAGGPGNSAVVWRMDGSFGQMFQRRTHLMAASSSARPGFCCVAQSCASR